MKNETRIVIRQNNYWSIGKDLKDARKQYWKAAHRQPTSAASILSFSGTLEDLKSITIDCVDGSVQYSKTLTMVRVQ